MHIRPGLLLLACFLVLVSPLSVRGEVFVTEDGTVYVGDAVGRMSDSILVNTADGPVTLKVSDLVELPPAVLQARGAIHQAKRYAALAEGADRAEMPGLAITYWQSALDELTAVQPEAEEESEEAKGLTAQYRQKLSDTTKELDEHGLAAYMGQTFPKKILAFHLDAGHELIRNRYWIKPSQRCPRCSGTGWLACSTCNQTGNVRKDCPDCTGGSIVCPHCKGTGLRKCPACDGSGQFISKCPACGATGEVVCDDCDGTGTQIVRCPRCHGKGFIVVLRRWTRDRQGHRVPNHVTRTCPTCHGARRVRITCPTCDGTGKTICTLCNGSGQRVTTCTTCRGRGVIACPKRLTCRRCGGTGWLVVTCPDCHGKGHLKCPECDGRGFTGQPQPDPPPEKADKPKAKADAD